LIRGDVFNEQVTDSSIVTRLFSQVEQQQAADIRATRSSDELQPVTTTIRIVAGTFRTDLFMGIPPQGKKAAKQSL